MSRFKLPSMPAEVISAGIIQQAAEKEYIAACVTKNHVVIERARVKCHDALDAYLDALKTYSEDCYNALRDQSNARNGG